MPRHTAIVAAKGNVAFGLEKGYKVTSSGQGPKVSRRKGKKSTRVSFVRSIIREVAGFAPYEKRCMELLRVSKDKRALKFCKKKLGTYSRGKNKRAEMQDVIQAMRMADSIKAGTAE
eukprot:gene14833-29423_t